MFGRRGIGSGAAVISAGSRAAGSSSMDAPIGSRINGNLRELVGASFRAIGSDKAMGGAGIDTPKKRLEYIFGETARGNGQPFLDALADDAEWTVIGSTGWAKTHRGQEQDLRDLIPPLPRALAPPRESQP